MDKLQCKHGEFNNGITPVICHYKDDSWALDCQAMDKKKFSDVVNQVWNQFLDSPIEPFGSDPISLLYDLSDNSNHGRGLLFRTASGNDLTNPDETVTFGNGERRPEYNNLAPNLERSLSAPCVRKIDERNGEEKEPPPQVTVKDIGRQILTQINNNQNNNSLFSNQYCISNEIRTLLDATKELEENGGEPLTTPPSADNKYHKQLLSELLIHRYEYVLEAPISVVQKKGDDTLTYLNKGQYYSIKFYANNTQPYDGLDFNMKVTTIVHLVFKDQNRKKEYEYWNYWYSQQPNSNIRVFDVDERTCQNIDSISEIGCNAVSFTWNSNIGARVVLRINCLSTEFSAQKGVKGTPLYVQLDTYEDCESSLNPEPADRCYSQIKVFRDKGAERKNKDESRSADRRLQKLIRLKKEDPNSALMNAFHTPSTHTVLTKTTVLSPKPVIFNSTSRALSNNLALTNNIASSVAPVEDDPLKSFYHSPTKVSFQAQTFLKIDGEESHTQNQEKQYYQQFHNVPTQSFTSPTQYGLELGSAGSSVESESAVSFQSEFWEPPGTTVTQQAQVQDNSFLAFIRERETKRTISQALTAANESTQHLSIASQSSPEQDQQEEDTRPTKAARLQKTQPVTIYVKKSDEKIYNALCISTPTLECLKDEVAAKYAIPKNMVAKLYKRSKKGLLIHMDNRMVEQFQDEDDFNVEISFINKDGIFEVTFMY